MSGPGYGLIPSGVYRMAPGLNRFQQGGSPLAALIGNALGTYESQHQQQQEDLLQSQREQDAAQGRKTDIGLRLLGAGYAPGAGQPSVDGATPTGMGPSIPNVTPGPDTYNISGVGPVHRIPTDKDTLATTASTAQRAERVRIGHALATQTLGHDVDDNTAEGIGGAPSAFIASQKPAPPEYTVVDGQYVPKVPGTGSAQPVPGFVKPTPAVKPTPHQGDEAEFGAGALAAWKNVEDLRIQNPGVEQEVGQIVTNPKFLAAVPGFHSSEDASRAIATAGGSPAAQQYLRAKWSFLDNIIRTRIQGGRISGPLFQNAMGEFMPGLDPAANGQVRQNELNAILSAQGESGYDVNPDLWNRATKRHKVDDVDLQDALSGGHGDKRMNAIRGRY